jgi:FK506-binding protein 2
MRLSIDFDALPIPLLATLLLLNPCLSLALEDLNFEGLATTSNSSNIHTLDNGLVINVTHPVTCSRKTQKEDTIFVHYRGTLASDGKQFDASYDRGKPFSFTLGRGQVIQGWDEGLLDMCIGEGRQLTVPPELGYGAAGAGNVIPGGATLSMLC